MNPFDDWTNETAQQIDAGEKAKKFYLDPGPFDTYEYEVPDDAKPMGDKWWILGNYPAHLQPVVCVLIANEKTLSDGFMHYLGFADSPFAVNRVAAIAQLLYDAAHVEKG